MAHTKVKNFKQVSFPNILLIDQCWGRSKEEREKRRKEDEEKKRRREEIRKERKPCRARLGECDSTKDI